MQSVLSKKQTLTAQYTCLFSYRAHHQSQYCNAFCAVLPEVKMIHSNHKQPCMHACGGLEPLSACQVACLLMQVLEQMQAASMQPDTIVYAAVIDLLWCSGIVGAQQRALQLFQLACRQNIAGMEAAQKASTDEEGCIEVWCPDVLCMLAYTCEQCCDAVSDMLCYASA